MPVINRFADLHDEIIGWRRDFHQNPELAFACHHTAEKVAGLLREFGCDEVVTGIAETGVVGVINGKGGGDETIGLRSDMDALPIAEITGADYASSVPGKMHACGHDGHMAMLLGAAKYLAETRNFRGRVAVIFQPAEEDGGGGEVMVREGMMERFNISQVYGMHNSPGLAVGEFAINSGPILASTDEYTMTITGSGGHAAKPHMAVDPTLCAAQLVIAMQSVVARNADPLSRIVVSVTSVWTETDTFNVIPQTAKLIGTVRTFEPENRILAEKRIREMAAGVGAAMGCEIQVEWEKGYPVTINDEAAAAFMGDVAEEVAGSVDRAMKPVLGAEDFSYMLEARPGAMISIGNGDSRECHHPAFDFADDAIPAGCSLWVRLAERALPL